MTYNCYNLQHRWSYPEDLIRIQAWQTIHFEIGIRSRAARGLLWQGFADLDK